MKVTATISKISLLIALLSSAVGSFAGITIDSVRTTISRCANDGTIRIYGTGSTALIYAIIAGPDIRPAQSGSQFGGLPSGSYQILVTDFSNDTVRIPATVGGTYQLPDFAPIPSDPGCAGTATGLIFGTPLTSGFPPYTWTLTNTGTGAVVTQSTDVFLNLPAGAYSLRMTDGCSGFATRSVTLTDHPSLFSIGTQSTYSVVNCKDAAVAVLINTPLGSVNHNPFIIAVSTVNGVTRDTLSLISGGNSYVFTPNIPVPDAGYGSRIRIDVTDVCGLHDSSFATIPVFDTVTPWFNTTSAACALQSYISFLPPRYYDGGPVSSVMHGPIYLSVFDAATGALVDTTITLNDSIFAPGTFNSSINSHVLPGNKTYNVVFRDTCGNSFHGTYVWPAIPAPVIGLGSSFGTCLDSTVECSLFCSYFPAQATFTIVSGPAVISSSKPGYAYRDTLHYPMTQVFQSPGQTNFGFGYENLGVGTYHYTVTDPCGTFFADSFTVRPSDVSDIHRNISYTRGCPGENKIAYGTRLSPMSPTGITASMSGYMTITALNGTYTNGRSFFLSASNLAMTDTLVNMNDGYYELRTEYYSNSFDVRLDTSVSCPITFDTIYIPPYQVPKIDYATQIRCSGTVNISLWPDSTRGVPPYQYEIISGPQTAPAQAGTFFTLTQPGTYVARISDVCGFAQAFTFAVDTLSFDPVVKVGSSCTGDAAMLICQHSPYATYIWQRPDGGIYPGDTMVLTPVVPTDYGTYHITKIVDVNNCHDTVYGTYTLTGNIYYDSATICLGQSFTVGSHTYSLSGIYSDTTHTSGCDSIHIFRLTVSYISSVQQVQLCAGQSITVGTHVYTAGGFYIDTFTTTGCDSLLYTVIRITGGVVDSVSRSICNGQSITVGTHTYSATGIYRDTFATGTLCDSIHILNLQVGNYKRDSIAQTICSGLSIAIGTHVYNAAGIYRDTFPTSTCDSIYILNLSIGNTKRDSVSQSICTGQSVTVGTHIYTISGIYRDTFATSSCDSIYILNLVVGSSKRDSVSQSICTGQNVSVGTHIYNASGIYRDTFATTGCDSIHILNLSVGSFKRDSISQTICAGQSTSVGIHVYNATGIYRDTFATTSCDSIHILNLLVGNIKRDSVSQNICAGQSITVGIHIYNATGIYRDTFATTACDSIHILNLHVGTITRDTIAVAFCEGGSIAIAGHVYTTAGVYADTFATAGCDSIRTIYITTYRRPDVHITASAVEAEMGDTIQLSATGTQPSTYFWTATGTLSDAHSSMPAFVLSQSTWVAASATSADHCTAADSLFITVKVCEPAVFVPNAFTPNGDGVNDKYRIFGRCTGSVHMQIFNRWGEKVWEGNDINDTWDGSYRGAQQPTEVYVYWLTYTGMAPGSREVKMTGSITLIR